MKGLHSPFVNQLSALHSISATPSTDCGLLIRCDVVQYVALFDRVLLTIHRSLQVFQHGNSLTSPLYSA